MSNKKQDSINWLLEEINKQKAWADPSKLEPIIQQAKAMHKEEIVESHHEGYYSFSHSGEQYYNETFGGETE